MKTIDEAAKELCNGRNYRDLQIGFKSGVEFAQKWYSIEKGELPEFEEILTKVIVKLNGRAIEMCVGYEIANFDRRSKTFHIESPSHTYVTHWRPIELK